MDKQSLDNWSNALDSAELHPLAANLPDSAPAGTIYNDGENRRKWLRVAVVRGNTDARWAYWLKMMEGKPVGFEAVADKIFNGDAAHFIGMLSVPYVRLPGNPPVLTWVLVEPRMREAAEPRQYEEKPKERYERSKEVFDVNTGKSDRLP